jgi:mannan endo-1,4-beta-mannosidase
MYAVYNTAQKVIDYLDAIQAKGWPLVIGEFGWQFSSSEVDHETILAQAQARGLGYIGWSWSGNTDPILDMATGFNPAQLTTWGQRIFNGANGIKATAKEASVYSGVITSPSASVSVSPSRSVSPSVSVSPSRSASSSPPPAGRTCTAAYSIVGQWPGGFQGDVKVTAGSSAISGWTVTWTFANGQAITQSWNAAITSSGSAVTARNVSYNGGLGAGAATNFGFLGSWNGSANAVPALSCSAS